MTAEAVAELLRAYWTAGHGAVPLGPGAPVTCQRCGALATVDWCEITAVGDPVPQYVPGMVHCPTPGCGTSCPICHRQPGDIHSGACAPIVLAKLTDPTRVTVEDCRTAVVR